jgi:UDP-2,3-diacylglucosamine pyrophosphatase LpxH
LKNHSAHTLLLNGDIVDGWQLKRGGSWKRKHTEVFRQILEHINKYNTKVVYLRGNHDDFLDQILPLTLGKNFCFVQNYIYDSGPNSYYVTHGDVFDSVTTHMKWLAYLGDVGYTFLLKLNKIYNNYRAFRGLGYYSLSALIKNKVKLAVNYINDFEEKLVELALAQNCQGIICGHIHQPCIRQLNGITYLNSGDWVESLTALVEDHDHNWSLYSYTQEQQSWQFDIDDTFGEEWNSAAPNPLFAIQKQ